MHWLSFENPSRSCTLTVSFSLLFLLMTGMSTHAGEEATYRIDTTAVQKSGVMFRIVNPGPVVVITTGSGSQVELFASPTDDDDSPKLFDNWRDRRRCKRECKAGFQ